MMFATALFFKDKKAASPFSFASHACWLHNGGFLAAVACLDRLRAGGDAADWDLLTREKEETLPENNLTWLETVRLTPQLRLCDVRIGALHWQSCHI